MKDAKLLGFRVLRYLFPRCREVDLARTEDSIFFERHVEHGFYATSANFGHWLSKLSC